MGLCCATLALASPAIASEPRFIGACDASAAVTLAGGALLVASDEDNLLRAYVPGRPEPLFQLDVSPMLGGPALREEADLEGATRIDDRLYWIASHGADKNGRRRAARHALFAMRELERDGRVALVPVGTVHTGLIEALARHPALRDVPLAEAATLPPKQEGALNIEALGADPDGRLWIGFRNPIRARSSRPPPNLSSVTRFASISAVSGCEAWSTARPCSRGCWSAGPSTTAAGCRCSAGRATPQRCRPPFPAWPSTTCSPKRWCPPRTDCCC
jgi:hypothetical protein